MPLLADLRVHADAQLRAELHRPLAKEAMKNPTDTHPASRDPFSVEAMPAPENPFAEPVLVEPTDLELALAESTFGFVDREDFEEQTPSGESNVAIEVLVTWGTTVLHVAHLHPPRSYVIGEATDDGGPVDFEIAGETLGRERLPLVLVEDGVTRVLVPDVAVGEIVAGKSSTDLREVMATSEPCPSVTRARQQRLGPGMHVSMSLPGVEVRVGMVRKSAPIERGLLSNVDWNVPSYFAMTAIAAAALMTSLAYFVPPQGLVDDDGLSKERLMLISHYLDAASEREQEAIEEPQEESGSDGGAEAKRAEGAEGEAGKEEAPRVQKRVAVKGPRENQTLQLTPELLREINETGMIGLLNGAALADVDAPHSVFGADLTLGNNDISAQGGMWGDVLGESGGANGLGLSGSGFGGGDLYGKGLGFGVGRVGTIGLGATKEGFGNSHGRPGGEHKTRAPRMTSSGVTSLSGRIPAHVIQRTVRQNFGRFRMCYEQGLGRNPTLEGRVSVRFVIGRDGSVSNSSASGDIPDAGVKSCVANAFYGLSFPSPENGIVSVTYPLMFSPE